MQVCPFDAIHVENGVAKVDKEACKACGKCVEVCPKHLISLIPYDAKYAVACSSLEKGPVAMKECTTACIGCQLCKKNCPADAVTVENFNATIDYEKCAGSAAFTLLSMLNESEVWLFYESGTGTIGKNRNFSE